ncbi:hypothetical protein LWF01_02780 [Saxibacter everestensis]|uniref:Minor tail protein n=1 Tax=Saxibacter everestensis TaxID=2909229 RepID=A0ABY8QUQ0_9MICO|nr:hypothetical protein LWF01_02780 [Brevibacteriaceae bacterium ZFBP1038]
MAYKGPLDYIDVATRIVEFRTQYPDGRLRQKDVQFVDFAGKSWVVYTAEAWRSQDDPAPAHGTAWEPVPGPTQFTRDSELQNAETAAWGRAMVAALAVDTRKGIASSEEVRNRQAPSASYEPSRDHVAAARASGSPDDVMAIWQAARGEGAPAEYLDRIAAIGRELKAVS